MLGTENNKSFKHMGIDMGLESHTEWVSKPYRDAHASVDKADSIDDETLCHKSMEEYD